MFSNGGENVNREPVGVGHINGDEINSRPHQV